MADENVATMEQIQRRPEYLERLEKGLLDAIFGRYIEGTEGQPGRFEGGIPRSPLTDISFAIPQYQRAGQLPTVYDPATGQYTSFGLETFVQESLKADADANGIPDFMERYQPFFGQAGEYITGGGEALYRGLGSLGDAASFFGPAAGYVTSGAQQFGAGDVFRQALSPAESVAREAALAGTEGVSQGFGEFGAQDIFGRALLPAEMIARQSALTGIEAAGEGMGRFAPSDVTQFMDPYRQQVVDEAMRQIERQGDVARQRAAAQAVGAGAFGGSRQGLQAAEVERSIGETKAGAISNLLSAGYSEALQRAMEADERARARALQTGQITGQLGLEASRQVGSLGTAQAQAQQAAFEEARRRALSGGQITGQLGLEAAKQLGALGTTQAEAELSAFEDASKRSLEAGRLLGGLGQSFGQIGTQYGQLGQQYGQLGGTTADIGRVYSALAPADLATMYGYGEAERAYRQQGLDLARQEQMRPLEQALLPYNYAYSVLSGTPSASLYSQYTSQTQPATNPYLAGLGAYTALQGVYGQQ